MTYRDRPLACPRCGVELSRTESEERWSCVRCRGALVGVGEVIRELLAVAPHLAPEGGIRDLSTLGRRTEAVLTCPACADVMEPVFLGGKEVDRCRHDQVLWFDVLELEEVIEIARGQPRRSWLAHFLFGR